MPVTTRVFEEFKIDYCCHGNTPFGTKPASECWSHSRSCNAKDWMALLDGSAVGDHESFSRMDLERPNGSYS
ncbi:MAG: DUF542 domain-containing protein [Acidobacteria bacterium]|nr:DUF542 domain-containing protein [Acidobacteriota bacterium]